MGITVQKYESEYKKVDVLSKYGLQAFLTFRERRRTKRKVNSQRICQVVCDYKYKYICNTRRVAMCMRGLFVTPFQ